MSDPAATMIANLEATTGRSLGSGLTWRVPPVWRSTARLSRT